MTLIRDKAAVAVDCTAKIAGRRSLRANLSIQVWIVLEKPVFKEWEVVREFARRSSRLNLDPVK
jgi:hypothetical protein